MKTKLLLAALLAAFSVGCADEAPTDAPSTESASVKEGLTILEAPNETGFSASFKKGEHVVFLQALRGKQTPAEYRKDPTMPQFEVDARFKDETGRIFLLQRGGDDWVEPKWADELDAQNAAGVKPVSADLFSLAEEAVAALETAPELVAAADSPQLRAVVNMGRFAPATLAAARLGTKGVLDGTNKLEVEYGSDKGGPDALPLNTGAGVYQLQLFAGVISGTLDCMGAGTPYHSATQLRGTDLYGNPLPTVNFCNHGRCPGDSTMYSKGTMYTTKYSAVTIHSCTTGYHAFSNDGHNCHDDSRVQMASLLYGIRAPGSRAWCNKDDNHADISCGIEWLGGDQDGHPYVNTSTNRGYNHKHMCRVQGTHGYNSAGGCYCDSVCVQYGDCCIDGPW